MATATTKTPVDPNTPPALPTVPRLTAAEKVKYQRWVEDKVVRAVREAGHCTEALAIMNKVFGKPSDTGYTDDRGRPMYVDSDGVDCWGNTWRDANGYDRNGLDAYGRDREGYDKDGFDVQGWDREGKDRDGLAKDSPERFKYDRHGYDAEGFNRMGVNANGLTREQAADTSRFTFDKDGYDAEGFDSGGYNRRGESRRQAERRRERETAAAAVASAVEGQTAAF